jgi:ADP-ribosylglycohydrolase
VENTSVKAAAAVAVAAAAGVDGDDDSYNQSYNLLEIFFIINQHIDSNLSLYLNKRLQSEI